MFGHRCEGRAHCGHQTNWTCPCTCDEGEDYSPSPSKNNPPPLNEVERLKMQIEGLLVFVQHASGCEANDFDYLDKTPCACGLRKLYNPKGCATDAG